MNWKATAIKLARLGASSPESGETANAGRALAKLITEHEAAFMAEPPKRRAMTDEDKRRAVVDLVETFIPGAKQWARKTARAIALDEIDPEEVVEGLDDDDDDDDNDHE